MNDLRIVLLGKTGDGGSSTGNTILGEETFHTESSSTAVTHRSESKRKTINKRKITVIDTPGFFDSSLPEEELNREILRCITKCAPGPHAFLIVLRVGRYTEQEKKVVEKMTALFGEDALRYAVVLFTHGNDLSENQTIQDFVRNNAELRELVHKCGGRVHVIDNKHWKQQQDGYRSNRVQVEDLLNTIEEIVNENGGQHYTNEMLQMVQNAIEEELKKNTEEGREKERIKKAKKKVQTKLSVRLAGVVTGIVVGAFLGAVVGLSSARSVTSQIIGAPALARAVGLQGAGPAEVTQAANGFVKLVATVGGVVGGFLGYDAVENAETVTEAIKMGARAVFDTAKDTIGQIKSFFKL